MSRSQSIFIGIDIGTSGVRACAINENEELLQSCHTPLPAPVIRQDSITQSPAFWWLATYQVLGALLRRIDASQVLGISVNGTSGTVLACDIDGTPLAPALMYNDSSCRQQAAAIKPVAPNTSAAHGSSSGLAKLLYLQQTFPQAAYLLHQADWIVGKLCGRFDVSDENNALKSGYDPVNGCWPEWLAQLNLNAGRLPDIVPPATSVATVKKRLLKKHKLNPSCRVISGTTDSVAAFIATGAHRPGDAVTSLGSTLVLKIMTDKPLCDPAAGIYSHKLGDYWLAGGASNTGGAVLRHYFSQQQIDRMTPLIKPSAATGFNYYPLISPGERFPFNDPELSPRLEPKADSEVEFFQGMLEGISRIELQGYQKLQQLGAAFPTHIDTAGGGSKNNGWTEIRAKMLNTPVKRANFSEACYGSALLAKRGIYPELIS
ncbi:Carbohydrate kinase, FGGY family [hydrothermal vent metagenome]|uniref:Carbohydrate kinase, FGGY family n=1 Tax=hydrothermal vent metagenome TaxID=652676 RepID=A0A3B0XUN9_9ZZZZ